MNFKNIELALTFDDVLLRPKHSIVLPRQVDLSTKLSNKIEAVIGNKNHNRDRQIYKSLIIELKYIIETKNIRIIKPNRIFFS